jgi:hypothetical protein
MEPNPKDGQKRYLEQLSRSGRGDQAKITKDKIVSEAAEQTAG